MDLMEFAETWCKDNNLELSSYHRKLLQHFETNNGRRKISVFSGSPRHGKNFANQLIEEYRKQMGNEHGKQRISEHRTPEDSTRGES